MALEAVLLDVGGTLLHEVPDRATIYAEAARARGIDVTDGRMLGLMRAAHHGLPERLNGAYRYTDPWFEAFIGRIFRDELGLGAEALREVTGELFDRFESAATFRLYPGCHELLEACRGAGLKLGIVSNWSARLSRVLASVGIADGFDFVVCSALEGFEKPAPELFQRALELARVEAEAALYAGNHVRQDGYGARAVGIEAILVDHDGALATDPEATSFPRVGGLSELARRILSNLP